MKRFLVFLLCSFLCFSSSIVPVFAEEGEELKPESTGETVEVEDILDSADISEEEKEEEEEIISENSASDEETAGPESESETPEVIDEQIILQEEGSEALTTSESDFRITFHGNGCNIWYNPATNVTYTENVTLLTPGQNDPIYNIYSTGKMNYGPGKTANGGFESRFDNMVFFGWALSKEDADAGNVVYDKNVEYIIDRYGDMTSDLDLYASWVEGYTMYFYSSYDYGGSGGNRLHTIDVMKGEPIGINYVPYVQPGKRFAGWKNNGEVFTDVASIVPTDSMAFDAVFVNSGNPVYKVYIHPGQGKINGYSGEYVLLNAEQGFAILSEDYISPIRDGYVLAGYSKASGSKKIYVTEDQLLELPITGDIHLYAVYNKITPLSSISFTETTMDLAQDASELITVTYNPAEAADKSLIWTSSNSDVATVDQTGKVTGVSFGTAVIEAVSATNAKIKASLTVTVHEPLKSIQITNAPESIKCGDTFKLNLAFDPDDDALKKVFWSSSHPEIISVDQNGNIVALQPGSATISAESEQNPYINSKTDIKAIPVPVFGLEVKSNISMFVKETRILDYKVLPTNATNKKVSFVSSNPDIISVDENGVLIANVEGKASVTVTTEDGGFNATCTVTAINDEVYIQGLNEEGYTYTGSAIKPAIQVYDSGMLLTEKTDFSVDYKNNSKVGTAEITITGKGSYSSKVTKAFEIKPADLSDASAEAITLVSSGKKQTLRPKVTWNGKALKSGTDYEINDYGGWDQVKTGSYTITLKGKGNFTGTLPVSLNVAEKSSDIVPVSKLKITSKTIKYDQIKDADDKLKAAIDASGFAVSEGKTPLELDQNYEITGTPDCNNAGTCTFVIKGIDGRYYGERTVSIKVTGTAISGAAITGAATFDGKNTQTLANNSSRLNVTIKNGGTLQEGKDYEVVEESYENNFNAGKASVTIRGLGEYTGTKKLSYTINPDTTKKTVTVVKSAEYAKGGALPEVIITASNGTRLREGADYKLAYKNNKKANTTGTVTVSFLGNYAGSSMNVSNPISFTITPKKLEEDAVKADAPDLAYKNKKGNYKSKITVLDSDGKKLAASDYTIVSYEANGQTLGSNDIVPENSVVTVKIQGKGNYTGTKDITYRVISAPLDLSKAKIILKDQEYTGRAITVDKNSFKIQPTFGSGKSARNITFGKDFEVLCYENNVKKGSAKVTFVGTGEFSGTKTVTMKITQRKVDSHWSAIDAIRNALGF